MKIFEYCPTCKHIETKEVDKLPKTARWQMCEWGQPIRLTECECGNLKGFFDLTRYELRGELDEGMYKYLMYRVNDYVSKINQ